MMLNIFMHPLRRYHNINYQFKSVLELMDIYRSVAWFTDNLVL